jgi:hypothetical protein
MFRKQLFTLSIFALCGLLPSYASAEDGVTSPQEATLVKVQEAQLGEIITACIGSKGRQKASLESNTFRFSIEPRMLLLHVTTDTSPVSAEDQKMGDVMMLIYQVGKCIHLQWDTTEQAEVWPVFGWNNQYDLLVSMVVKK